MRLGFDRKDSDETAVPAVAAITLVWLVGLVVVLITRSSLEESGRDWWLWVAAAGLLTGILALLALTRRARRLGTRSSVSDEKISDEK